MTHTYFIKQGIWVFPDGTEVDAYSGHKEGLNNPEACKQKGVGPLPPGHYKIGLARNDCHLGPFVMNLDPLPETEMFGRDLIRLHGDNGALNHTASDGCIVMGRTGRMKVSTSICQDLEVVDCE